MEIITALIGAAATVLAAVLPGILERNSRVQHHEKGTPQPYAKGIALLFVVIAAFAFVMARESCEEAVRGSCGFGCSPMQVFFFLSLAGVCSALFGHASSRVNSDAGVWVGYGSAIFVVLLLVFWLITDWTGRGGLGDKEIVVRYAKCNVQQFHLLVFFILATIGSFRIIRHQR